MPYPEFFVAPMREELTRLGVEELRTARDVDTAVASTPGTLMIMVNSVCGCAAGKARPGLMLALRHPTRPNRLASVFAGFDVLTTATNHALDCGSLGWGCKGQSLDDTRRNILGAGIRAVGTGDTPAKARAPVIVERQGVRFAFLGVNAIDGENTWVTDTQAGTAPLSTQSLADVTADIALARSLADVVIVLPHWGIEYQAEPSADQRTWAPAMVAAGADLVIGNHPHLVQPVETVALGGVVAYALGNFVFDQGPADTHYGAAFEAVFEGRTLARWRLLPVRIYDLHQPRWTGALPGQ